VAALQPSAICAVHQDRHAFHRSRCAWTHLSPVGLPATGHTHRDGMFLLALCGFSIDRDFLLVLIASVYIRAPTPGVLSSLPETPTKSMGAPYRKTAAPSIVADVSGPGYRQSAYPLQDTPIAMGCSCWRSVGSASIGVSCWC
jgi:hypothetical protein